MRTNFVNFEARVDEALRVAVNHPGLEKSTVVWNGELSKNTIKKIDELVFKLKSFRRDLE